MILGAKLGTTQHELANSNLEYERLHRPSAARRYCHFLESHGVFGFSWTPVELVYNCPPGMEYDPNDETGYCLYREVSPPGAVEAACEDFETTGELAFRFPCDTP